MPSYRNAARSPENLHRPVRLYYLNSEVIGEFEGWQSKLHDAVELNVRARAEAHVQPRLLPGQSSRPWAIIDFVEWRSRYLVLFHDRIQAEDNEVK